jgi:hypothetical protein
MGAYFNSSTRIVSGTRRALCWCDGRPSGNLLLALASFCLLLLAIASSNPNLTLTLTLTVTLTLTLTLPLTLTLAHQEDNAGPHKEGKYHEWLTQEFVKRGWKLELQAPQVHTELPYTITLTRIYCIITRHFCTTLTLD